MKKFPSIIEEMLEGKCQEALESQTSPEARKLSEKALPLIEKFSRAFNDEEALFNEYNSDIWLAVWFEQKYAYKLGVNFALRLFSDMLFDLFRESPD